jgi:hypothetical protein
MDKPEFIEKAPSYYALGLMLALWDGTLEPLMLNNVSRISNQLAPDGSGTLFSKTPLLSAAVDLLTREGGPICVIDDFAPTIYKKGPDYSNWFFNVAPGTTPRLARGCEPRAGSIANGGEPRTHIRSGITASNMLENSE